MRAVDYGISKGMPLQATYPYRINYAYSNMCKLPLIPSNTKFSTSGQALPIFSRKTRFSDATIIRYLLQRPLVLGVDAS